MKNAFLAAGVVVLACCLSGCGSKADGLVKDRVKLMNDLADAVEKDAPEAKWAELQKDMAANAKQLEDLKLSASEMEKLFDKYKDDLGKANGRLLTAFKKKGLPVPGDLAIAFASQSASDGAPLATKAQVREEKETGQARLEERRTPPSPVPQDKWDVKYFESNYPIKLTKIDFDGDRAFTLTFEFTKDDTEKLVQRDARLNGVLYFFDADNTVATQGRVDSYESAITGKKGERFRCSVNVKGPFDVLRNVKRVEVREE